jgi:hypothetical protein
MVLVLTFYWARRFASNASYAAVGVAALATSPAFLGLESRIFPDLVGARHWSASAEHRSLPPAPDRTCGRLCLVAPTWGRVEGQNPMHMALHERLGIELRPIMPTFDLHAGLMRGGWQLSAWITVAILVASWGILLAYTRKESNSSPQSRRRSLDAGLRPDLSRTQD